MNLLIFNEAEIDPLARNDLTPLMVVCTKGDKQISKILITAGANIVRKDGGGNSAFHYAAKSGNLDLIEYLAAFSVVNLKSKNNLGMTPYDLAQDKKARDFLETLENEAERSERETLIKIHTYRNENFAFLNNKMNLEFSQQDTTSAIHSHSSNTSYSDLTSMTDESEKAGPQNFLVHSLLGRGSFGEVYLVEKKDTGVFYAMKVLYKNKMISKTPPSFNNRKQPYDLRKNRKKCDVSHEPSFHCKTEFRIPDQQQAVSDP